MALIIKCRMRLTERALIIMAGMVLVIIIRIMIIKRIIIIKRMMIMERILVALKYKKGGKDRCYRFY